MTVRLFQRERPLHLFFFPLLFVVNHFFAIVTPAKPSLVDSAWAWILNFAGAVLVCVSLPVVLQLLISRKLNRTNAAILSTVLALPFFFLQDLLLSSDQVLRILRARFIFPILFLLLALLVYAVYRARKPLYSLSQYLTITSVVIVIYTAGSGVLTIEKLRPKILSYNAPVYTLDCETCSDIYLFLLDSYTSNRSLRDHFEFENREFTENLKSLDFAVSDQAVSSYSLTGYSLNATFNLDQIRDLDLYTYGLGEAIRLSSVIKSLKRANYEIRNYSIFDIGDQPKYYSVNPSIPVGFLNGIVQNSILNIIIYDVAMKLRLYKIHRDILERVDEEVAARERSPKFVYAHIFAPHPPFVIDENGQAIPFFDQPKNMANLSAYVAQVRGINKLLSGTIAEIRKTSPDAVIVIMGDHGYRYLATPAPDEESFTVFLAYHGPNQEELDSLPNSNQIFRLILKGAQGR